MDSSKLRVGPGVDPDSSAFASPFDHLLHAYVPKDHEIAARQAVYNAAALAALAALCAGAFFASSILEPFLLPILWAVLTGFLLHPHKAAVSLSAKRWLERAAEADRPLLLHCAVSGVSGAVALCDALGSYLMGLWRTLLAVAAVAVALLFMVGLEKKLYFPPIFSFDKSSRPFQASANQNAVALVCDLASRFQSAAAALSVLGAHHQGQQEGEPVGGVQDGQGGGRRLEAGGEVAHEGNGVLVGGGLERKMEDYLINEKIGGKKCF